MSEWVKWDKDKGDPEWKLCLNPDPAPYKFYKIKKGDIIPVTLDIAINEKDTIFNSGAFKVVDICKDEFAGAVFKVMYIKEDSEQNEK